MYFFPATVLYDSHVVSIDSTSQVVGDNVLEGVPSRGNTVIAVTDCQFAVINASDYAKVRERGHLQMTLDDKCHHLK